MDNNQAERFLPIAEVCGQTSFSRAFIYDAVRRGQFPAPIKISPNRVAWTLSSVQKFIAAKIGEAA